MDQRSFPLFPQLPPELRRTIFLMATETRVVRLYTESLVELTEQEQEDGVSPFEAFSNRLAPWNLTVDPNMAHFAQDWRSSIGLPQTPPRSSWNFCPRNPNSAIQTLLTDFGFTTTKPRRLPWTPTSECPDIPPHLLYAEPVAAWKMTRPHYLFSIAPIPPLLHTCLESREVLMRYGYQLAFGTRTAAPRTWFCFHRDVLFLPRLFQQWSNAPEEDLYDTEYHADADIGIWDLDPHDLTRVRRLALWDDELFYGLRHTWRALRACQNVVELFAVEAQLAKNTSTLDIMLQAWRHSSDRRSVGAHGSSSNTNARSELLELVDPVREQLYSGEFEADFRCPMLCGPREPFDFIVWEDRDQAFDLEEFEESQGSLEVVKLSCEMRRELQRQQREQLAEMVGDGEEAGTGGEVKSWRIPSVRRAFFSTRRVIDWLRLMRGLSRRWHRQEGRLVPWEMLPWEERWDLLDGGPIHDGYLSCWIR